MPEAEFCPHCGEKCLDELAGSSEAGPASSFGGKAEIWNQGPWATGSTPFQSSASRRVASPAPRASMAPDHGGTGVGASEAWGPTGQPLAASAPVVAGGPQRVQLSQGRPGVTANRANIDRWRVFKSWCVVACVVLLLLLSHYSKVWGSHAQLPDTMPGEVDDIAVSASPAVGSVLGALLGSEAERLPPECAIPGEEYVSSSTCSRDLRNEWFRLAAMPAQKDSCRVEYGTGQIVCDTQVSCEGGMTRNVENMQVKKTMDYDCSNCHNVQKRSCCEKCSKLRETASRGSLTVGGDSIHEVVCKHCDTGDLSDIVPQHSVNCLHNEHDGTFRCSMSEHCSDGRLRTNTYNLSYSCVVTPCDTCADSVARAQCCSQCLEHYCHAGLTFADRRVCRGCGSLPAR